MMFKYSNLAAWVVENEKLKSLTHGKVLHDDIFCSYKFPCIFNIGFLRVIHHKADDQDTFRDLHFLRGVQLDETPKLNMFCIENQPYISVMDVPHQAMWLFAREDILELNSSCQFFEVPISKYVNPNIIREYWSSYSLYRNRHWIKPPSNCMISKVLPAAKLESFTVEHFRRSGKSNPDHLHASLYLVDKLTRNGKSYLNPAQNMSIPPCWIEPIEKLNVQSLMKY